MTRTPLLAGGRLILAGRLALLSGSVATPPATASTFSIALSAASGPAGQSVTMTVAPIGGSWPAGAVVTAQNSGLMGIFDHATLGTSGAASVAFVFTSSAASGPAMLNATVPGMAGTGGKSYTATTVVTPPPSGAANRYDVVFDQSVIAPGGTVTGNVYLNGASSGGSVVLTPGSGSAITIPLPSSGNAAVPFSFPAPSIGDDYFAPTNTAGLLNPYPAQISAFAGSAGTNRTFAAALAGVKADLRTFQRDAVNGNPAGFSLSWARGWGAVAINISSLSGATDGVWMRPYDAFSSGVSTTAGTGTALHAPVQVHGALGATGTINPLLPAGLEYLYWDIATDAAFTNPVRIAQRFRVGVVVADASRSQETGFAQSYADSTAFTPINTRFAVWTSGDPRYAADQYTGIHWTLSTDTSAGQELARILEAQLGVGVALTGVSATGGGLDQYFAHDGTPSSAFQDTVNASCGGKFRYLTVSMGGWDGVDGSYPSETFAEDQTRIQAAVARLPHLYPACAVIRWCTSDSGWFGNDGSRDLGYTRLGGITRALEASNPNVVDGASDLWNEFIGGHASQAARLDYARTAGRMILAADVAVMGGLGTANRGPTLGTTGTLSSRTLRLPYTQNGGSALTSVRAAYSNPSATYGTASTSELASLFSVYAGAGGRQGAGLAIKIDSAAINSGTGTVDLVLTGSSGVTYADGSTGGMPGVLNVHYGADYGASNATIQPQWMTGGPGVGVSLCDDVSEFSIPYGRLMRPTLDIAIATV